MAAKGDQMNNSRGRASGSDAGLFHSGGNIYEIYVKGHLDPGWSDWLEGLEMRLLDTGEMVLFGPITDQAALMGILTKLNRLNLTILSVNKVSKNE